MFLGLVALFSDCFVNVMKVLGGVSKNLLINYEQHCYDLNSRTMIMSVRLCCFEVELGIEIWMCTGRYGVVLVDVYSHNSLSYG